MKGLIRKTVGYVALALCFYAVFLIVTMPATRAYHLAKENLGTVMLHGVDGTIWRGHAEQLVSPHLQLTQVSWQLNPWVLLIGRLEAELDFKNGDKPGHAIIGRSLGGKFYLKEVDTQLPATIIGQLTNLPLLKWEGSIEVKLAGLSLEQGYVTEGEGSMLWNNAAISSPSQVKLGAFQATMENTPDGVKIVLADKGGAVQADALWLLKKDGNYQFTGSFSSRDPGQPGIAQGLQFLGSPGADGRIKVSANGSLPPLLGKKATPPPAATADKVAVTAPASQVTQQSR